MTDHFAALGLAPSPAVDPMALQSAFEKRSRVLHPDVAGGDGTEFRALNAAYRVLQDPAQRLRHLLELRAPDLLVRDGVPEGELVELFMNAGTVLQKLDAFQTREAAAGSPLARALLMPEKLDLIAGLQEVLGTLERRQTEAREAAEALAPDWQTAESLATLGRLQQRLAFLGKWTGALREKMLALDF